MGNWLFKHRVQIQFLIALTIGMGLEYRNTGVLIGWFFMMGFFGYYLGLFLVALGISFVLWNFIIPYCSIRFQRPWYSHWKSELLKNKTGNAFVDYSSFVFIELQLDREFEKGGLIQARRAWNQHLDDLPEKAMRHFRMSKLGSIPQKESQ